MSATATGQMLRGFGRLLAGVAERVRVDVERWRGVYAELVPAAGDVLRLEWRVFGGVAGVVRGNVDFGRELLAEQLPAAGNLLRGERGVFIRTSECVWRGRIVGSGRRVRTKPVPAAGLVLRGGWIVRERVASDVRGCVDAGGRVRAECVCAAACGGGANGACGGAGNHRPVDNRHDIPCHRSGSVSLRR